MTGKFARDFSIGIMVCMSILYLIASQCSCSTLKNYAASGKLSDTIAYYDRYVEGAAKWLSYSALIPGIAPYASLAAVSLGAADNALDNLKVVADSYRDGAATETKLDAALASVRQAIIDFNAVMSTIPKPVTTTDALKG